jgi:hypothetical protein
MDPIVQANQKIENRIAEIKEEAEYKGLTTQRERIGYINNDPELKRLEANRDALVKAQAVTASGFPFASLFFFEI